MVTPSSEDTQWSGVGGGGGRASYRVRILSRKREGISKGELRGETKKEELREEERWLGDFFFSST